MTSTAATPPASSDPTLAMSRREVLEALSGLMLAMLVAILSSTVVTTSLPKIIGDLGGGQSAYTWVVTSTLLTMTITTPIWGKFADMVDRKLLLQGAIVVFVVGSALAGLAQGPGQLIACRALQGIGTGGLMALVQVVMADIISPRERGRYMGLLGAVMAVGTIGGPLLGGVVTDTLGWRWNFYVNVPVAVAALVVLQLKLRLPTRERRRVRVDYLGATLVAGAVSLLLIWVTMAGDTFGWASLSSAAMVGGAIVLAVAFVTVERRVDEPIIPLDLFRDRTVVLTTIASVAVGVAMFGTTVFLSQYMQLARGMSPTQSGLLTIPMVVGSLISSIALGQIISRTGVWKRYVVGGTVTMFVGIALMGTVRYDTSWISLGIFMSLVGLGMGSVMQNLVLITQNVLPIRQIGSGSALINFFRTMGGAVGVSALGALIAHRVTTLTADGFARLGIDPGSGSGTVPDVSTLPEPVRLVVEAAYGEAIGDVFLAAAPLALVAVIAMALVPNRPLGTKTGIEQMAEDVAATAVEVPEADLVDPVEPGARTTSGVAYAGTGRIPDEPLR